MWHATTLDGKRRDFRLLTGPEPTPHPVFWFEGKVDKASTALRVLSQLTHSLLTAQAASLTHSAQHRQPHSLAPHSTDSRTHSSQPFSLRSTTTLIWRRDQCLRLDGQRSSSRCVHPHNSTSPCTWLHPLPPHRLPSQDPATHPLRSLHKSTSSPLATPSLTATARAARGHSCRPSRSALGWTNSKTCFILSCLWLYNITQLRMMHMDHVLDHSQLVLAIPKERCHNLCKAR